LKGESGRRIYVQENPGEDGRLKGVSGNTEQGICPICCKEEDWSRILMCEGTRFDGTRFRAIVSGILMEKLALGEQWDARINISRRKYQYR
jgi:hypothetical protein